MKNILLLLLFGLGIFACSQSKKMNQPTTLNDIWAMVSLGEKSYKDYIGQRPTIEFLLSEQKVYGNAGCNDYFGNLKKIEERALEINQLGSTRMACEPGNAEYEFLTMLEQVKAYQVESLLLTLFDEEGNELAVFKKVD